MIKKIISGGQTGIDRMALGVAKSLGIPTGGTAPKGYKTEDGPDLELKTIFGLDESWSSSYNPRTIKNVQDSDGTILYGNMSSPGSKLTISVCKENEKKYICNPNPDELVEFIDDNKIEILNVAGNRMSKLSNITCLTYQLMFSQGIQQHLT